LPVTTRAALPRGFVQRTDGLQTNSWFANELRQAKPGREEAM
jgi:hypothetical protein